jgi:hypothetical protein
MVAAAQREDRGLYPFSGLGRSAVCAGSRDPLQGIASRSFDATNDCREIQNMNKFSFTAAAGVLGCFLVCSVANAKITRVAVSKDSKIAKELGYTITLTENTEKSGLAGTTSF